MEDLKQYIPQILVILTLLAGGGTLGTVQYNASNHADDTRYSTTHTARITSDNDHRIYQLEQRISQLEGKH